MMFKKKGNLEKGQRESKLWRGLHKMNHILNIVRSGHSLVDNLLLGISLIDYRPLAYGNNRSTIVENELERKIKKR